MESNKTFKAFKIDDSVFSCSISDDCIQLFFLKCISDDISFSAKFYFMKESLYFERIKTDIPIDKLELNDKESIDLINSFNKEVLEICLNKELKSYLKGLFNSN